MRTTLSAIASQQGGLFTRQQALRAGYTRREIEAATRPDGRWITVRTGVFCERALVDAGDLRSRWLLRDRAALLVSCRPAVLSHDSAGRLLNIDMLEVAQPGTHLTQHGPRGNRTNSGITRHRDLLALCIEQVDGLVSTSYARTALDIGRLHGFRHGLVAVDSVRAKGVPLDDLEAELARMARHPHIARARAAVAASDAGAESVLETLGRELVLELGIGEVETQFAVRIVDGRIVWCDMRVGRHLFECDGLIKLRSVDEGGVATRTAAEVMRDERRREAEVCAEGFGMSRIYWTDCVGGGRAGALKRLRQEFDLTVAAYGRELTPEQRRVADDNPRRRATRLWTPRGLRRAA